MSENEAGKCPLGICDGTGIIAYEDNTFDECQCRKSMHVQNYIMRAGIPEDYRNKAFTDFRAETDKQKEVLAKLQQYVDEWSDTKARGIGVSLISHQTRVGKSHLVCAIGHALVEKYQTGLDDDLVLFVNVTNWIEKWRAFFARFGLKEEEQGNEFIDQEAKQREIDVLCTLDKRMNDCGCLILDDIGEVPGTQYVSSKLYSVVEYRSSNNKPILITSNHPWDKIKAKYGDDGVRIVDRLREKSAEYEFYFDEPLKKKTPKNKKK